VLEEKGSDEDEIDSDEDRNIFDKLIGQPTEPKRKKLIQDYDPDGVDQDESSSDDSDNSEDTHETESEGNSDSETSDEGSTDEDEESELLDEPNDNDQANDMKAPLLRELDMNISKQTNTAHTPGRGAG
jgi:cytoskeletal protein RodZ